jgi:hypothetical protein
LTRFQPALAATGENAVAVGPHSLRSVWVEFPSQKTAMLPCLQNLGRSAQLEHLAPQLADLFTLLTQRHTPASRGSLCLAHMTTQRLALIPRSFAIGAIGRPLSSARRTPRAINSSGYFFGRDMNAEFLARGPEPSFQGLRQTQGSSAPPMTTNATLAWATAEQRFATGI